MSVSSPKSLLLPAALLSGSIFCALTLPLAAVRSNPVAIEYQGDSIFAGELKDIAAPYVGLTALLSLSAGVASFSATGWRHSSRKSTQLSEEFDKLQEILRSKEAELEALKLSEPRLQATGLDFFLEDEVKGDRPVPKPKARAAQPSSSVSPIQTQAPSPKTTTTRQSAISLTSTTPVAQPRPAQTAPQHASHAPGATSNVAVSSMPAAQNFMSFSQATKAAVLKSQLTEDNSELPTVTIDQVNEVHSQLKLLMAQIESLQGSLAPSQSYEEMAA